MLTQDQIVALARACGGVVGGERQGSSGEWVVSVDLPDHRAKLRLLAGLASASGNDYDVIRLARAIVREAGARTDSDRAMAIHAWVRRHVHHCLEAIETFPDAVAVIELGIGDCDDSALLCMALCLAVGIEAAIQSFGDPPDHACAAVKIGGQWCPLEASIEAYPGEDPYAAAERLGVERSDLV